MTISRIPRPAQVPPKAVLATPVSKQVRALALRTVMAAPAQGTIADLQEEAAKLFPILKAKRSKWQTAFYGFGLAAFLFATGVSVHTLLTNKHAIDQVQTLGVSQTQDDQGVSQGTGGEPAEGAVSDQALANYQVSPELPRYLRIPSLGVFARIKHTGLTAEGAVDAPANINDVSWFNESAKPGNAIGSSLLLGHVSGWTAPGVFKKIDQLQPGTRFEIEKGSGEKLTYEVVRGERVPANQINMAKILASETPGEHDLKLMTCSGRYNRDSGHYEDRYIVYARILR